MLTFSSARHNIRLLIHQESPLKTLILTAAFLLITPLAHAKDAPSSKGTAKESAKATATKSDKKNEPKKGAAVSDKAKANDTKPVLVMETSMGKVEIELDGEKAPISTKNFLRYADENFYAGTIFHRVIKDFMIQGGGFTKDMNQKPVHDPIKNEAANGLKNTRGTLAMARTSVVDSATAQFFINTVDNSFLNYSSPDPRGYGYAVFGHVISGMDVVDKIRAAATTTKSGMGDVPVEAIEIKSMKRK
jgi:cyclophilin family peptidyl-prolyl cis-trans isomerase